MSLAYVGFGGLPMGRATRERVAWYGDADLVPHLLQLLSSGAVDITVSWGEAIAYDDLSNFAKKLKTSKHFHDIVIKRASQGASGTVQWEIGCKADYSS